MKLNYFNFKEFNGRVLLTNDFGMHLFVTKDEFRSIVSGNVSFDSSLGRKMIETNMAYEGTKLEYSSRHKYELYRVKGHVNMATSLHIFVVTTSCNLRCVYCQANNGVSCSSLYMSNEIAERAVDIALQSPAYHLNFEFQGGEPLLNFDVIRHIVEYSEAHKGRHEIKYSLVSNLTLINEEMLDFFYQHCFDISTSIDGPASVHDQNRSFVDGSGSFRKVVDALQFVRAKGLHVGAIQTTTKKSLSYPNEIVDTYVNLGFDGIFLRPLTPLGKAYRGWDAIGYTAEEYLDFYTRALDYIIDINLNGKYFREAHSTILFSRVDGHFTNYMELRSPCGAGIGQLAYYADGDVFTCDEGRMLHEMGDHSFRLGNVFHNSFTDIINNSVCKAVCSSSILEAIPSCCDCVYQPYCGTCPVVNYSSCNDIIEKEPRGYRCRINSGMLDYLFRQYLDDKKDVLNILKSWSN